MKMTFGLFDMAVKDECLTLINQRKNFSVTLVKDENGQPHHWLIEETNGN